jgi:hypothetical protein
MALFAYPKQAAFNRVLPKSKIYTYAKASRGVRERFVEEVDQIVWKFKLAPETVNLPARPGVPEIQVFAISLRTEEPSETILRTIDKAIPFPIFYELSHGSQIKSSAAYKRPSDAGSAKWVVDAYFETDWMPAEQPREVLPVALDLAGLYEQMLRRHIELPARPGESLQAQVERINAIRGKQAECRRLEARMRQENQFNRKVELNRELRNMNEELKRLCDPQISQSDADFKSEDVLCENQRNRRIIK